MIAHGRHGTRHESGRAGGSPWASTLSRSRRVSPPSVHDGCPLQPEICATDCTISLGSFTVRTRWYTTEAVHRRSSWLSESAISMRVGVRLQRPQGQAKRCHLTVACRRPHLEIGQGWLPSRSCFLSVQCHGLRARDFTKLCRPSPVILSKGASEASAVSEGSRRQKLQSTPYQAAIRSFAALRTPGKDANIEPERGGET